MKIVKIRNSYLFDSDKPNAFHSYAVYKKKKEIIAVQLTHLYVKDEKRFKQVKKGYISIEKFNEFDTPSGVRDGYYSKNVYGENIDLKDSKNVRQTSKRNISRKQAKRIMNFAKNNRNKKKTRK